MKTAGISLKLKTLETFYRKDEPKLIQQELIKRGILWAGFHNVCYSHTDEDIRETLNAYDEVLEALARALKNNSVASELKGKPVEPVFRKVGNVQKVFTEKLAVEK
ncbi:MAG: hypothetical protein K2U26_01535 [Cyclobacteriaceae bacterium]|nr:hypothetical protein [Cyclobacteriaceae bacterium]